MRIPLLACLFVTAACAHQKTAQPEKLVVSNPSGIVLQHKKALTVETPNMGPVAFYAFRGQNVPPHRKFVLQMTDELNPAVEGYELISDEAGTLWMSDDKRIPLQSNILPIVWRLPGEVASVWLVSKDRRIVVKASFVPYPLEAFGQDGAEVSVVRTKQDGSLVECQGAYFKDGECLEIVSKSKDKQKAVPVVAREGRFRAMIESPDPKSFGEMLTLEVVRESGERITLAYPWGRECFNRAHLMANTGKLKEEDRKVINEAIDDYLYPETSSKKIA